MQLTSHSPNFNELESFLEELVLHPTQHAAFINTLSLMEHIGSRKIMLSQKEMSSEILQHLAEETRHASFFKKQAEKVFGREVSFSEDELLARKASIQYFARLDSGISNALKKKKLPKILAYYYVTAVIEFRAEYLYETYDAILKKNSCDFRLRGILAEEKEHLKEILAKLQELDPEHSTHLQEFISLEKTLFENWFQEIKKGSQVASFFRH